MPTFPVLLSEASRAPPLVSETKTPRCGTEEVVPQLAVPVGGSEKDGARRVEPWSSGQPSGVWLEKARSGVSRVLWLGMSTGAVNMQAGPQREGI